MTIDPFSGELRDGKIWGRGASDTKGPMAAMLLALLECKDVLPYLSHEIWFAGCMGEEAGQQGPEPCRPRRNLFLPSLGNPQVCRLSIHTKDRSG